MTLGTTKMIRPNSASETRVFSETKWGLQPGAMFCLPVTPRTLAALLRVRTHHLALPFGCGIPSGSPHIQLALAYLFFFFFWMVFVSKAPHQNTGLLRVQGFRWGGVIPPSELQLKPAGSVSSILKSWGLWSQGKAAFKWGCVKTVFPSL